MAVGEEIKQDFRIIKTKLVQLPIIDLPTSTLVECVFYLPVLADSIGTDPFKNDVTSVLFRYDQGVSSVVYKLQQFMDGLWQDMLTLGDNTYGTLFPFGFLTDDKLRKYTGFKINWFLIKVALGEGIYRIKTVESTIFGETNQFGITYCLQQYMPHRADGTVKLETLTNFIRGDKNDPTDIIDFGEIDWYDSIRVCGMFGFDNSDYSREFVEYRNGQEKWVKDEQTQKYMLKLKPLPADVHNILRTDILQADEIKITDYNKNNPNKHIDVKVISDGNYAPDWKPGTSMAMVEVLFKSAFNNLRKKRC